MEEFRTLRTRLNHMKSLQPIHTVVVTSPSPAEGKSLSATNLALAEAHLDVALELLGPGDASRRARIGADRAVLAYRRGAVQAAVDLGKELRRSAPPTDEERRVLFNQTARDVLRQQ